MNDLSDLEKRLNMIETHLQDLEQISIANTFVLAWLLQRITRREPTSIEQVRRFLTAQVAHLPEDDPIREHFDSLLLLVADAESLA